MSWSWTFKAINVFKGTAFGKEVDPSNPFNMTGKEFDMAKSGVLAAIMERESAGQPRHTP